MFIVLFLYTDAKLLCLKVNRYGLKATFWSQKIPNSERFLNRLHRAIIKPAVRLQRPCDLCPKGQPKGVKVSVI